MPDLHEKHFRRIDKWNADRTRFRGWWYEVATAIEGINSKLNKDIKELRKTWQEEDRER